MANKDQILERLRKAAAGGEIFASSDFDLNDDEGRAKPSELREASVLIPFVERPDGWKVVLTKRTAVLKNHPGQIAFPGGKRDETDHSAEATALREAFEEIGLHPDAVEVLGALGRHETVTRFRVTPVLGVVSQDYAPVPEAGEVEMVFEVPLLHLMEPAMARIEGRVWNGVLRRYYVIPFGPFYIWGATARIIMGLRQRWEAVG